MGEGECNRTRGGENETEIEEEMGKRRENETDRGGDGEKERGGKGERMKQIEEMGKRRENETEEEVREWNRDKRQKEIERQRMEERRWGGMEIMERKIRRKSN